jgi:hypothetical protein
MPAPAAWKNNLAHSVLASHALLQPALGRFVFARARRTVVRAGTLHLVVKPDAEGRRLVHHHSYGVRIRLWVTFTPTGGVARSIGRYGLFVTR